MKIKDDSTYCRPPPTAPHEEDHVVIAVPVSTDDEEENVHRHQSSTRHQENNDPQELDIPEAHATPVAHQSTSNTLITEGDREAAALAEAAAAREHGTNLIRDHLHHHLEQNPCSSYVTWIATLHPENASVAIDPRFLIPGNPWLSVYEDAIKRPCPPTDATSATDVVPVVDGVQDEDKDNGVCHGGFLDTIIGWTLTVTSVATTFSLELVAMYLLSSIWLCIKLTTSTDDGGWGCFGLPVNILTFLPFCICQLIRSIFNLVNYIVLFLSILMVELMAGLSLLLCTLFSCSYTVGLEHHQRTRRTSHLIRWAFRKRFEPNPSPASDEDGSSDENAVLQDQHVPHHEVVVVDSK